MKSKTLNVLKYFTNDLNALGYKTMQANNYSIVPSYASESANAERRSQNTLTSSLAGSQQAVVNAAHTIAQSTISGLSAGGQFVSKNAKPLFLLLQSTGLAALTYGRNHDMPALKTAGICLQGLALPVLCLGARNDVRRAEARA